LPHTPSSHVLLMPNSKHLTHGISNLVSFNYQNQTWAFRSSPRATMAGSRSSPRCAPRQPAAPLLCCCSSPLHAMAHARPRLTCTPRPAALLRPRLARHLCLARGRGRCTLDVGRTPSAFSVPWEPVSRANMLSWARPQTPIKLGPTHLAPPSKHTLSLLFLK
jgi:hypothetical protein